MHRLDLPAVEMGGERGCHAPESRHGAPEKHTPNRIMQPMLTPAKLSTRVAFMTTHTKRCRERQDHYQATAYEFAAAMFAPTCDEEVLGNLSRAFESATRRLKAAQANCPGEHA